ncbi:MAG: hypothetical protein AAGG75_03085 [Bacteroidota bacterium]
MKSTFIISFFLSILLINLWACAEQKNTDRAIINNEGPTWPIQDSLPSFQIEPEKAFEYANNYREYIDGVKDSLGEASNDTRLIYGARVAIDELKEILFNSSATDTSGQLYVMLGIMPSDSTEVIFTLQSGITSEWTSYDFTLPCPTGCPEWLDLEYME